MMRYKFVGRAPVSRWSAKANSAFAMGLGMASVFVMALASWSPSIEAQCLSGVPATVQGCKTNVTQQCWNYDTCKNSTGYNCWYDGQWQTESRWKLTDKPQFWPKCFDIGNPKLSCNTIDAECGVTHHYVWWPGVTPCDPAYECTDPEWTWYWCSATEGSPGC